jgi:hypothetical protein
MVKGRLNRAILHVLLLGTSVGLAGCEPGEMIDKLSDMIPSSKTPLPGTRKEVFPEGVPGVPQGVPPELVKGYQPPSDVATLQTPAVASATREQQTKSAAAEPPKPKKKKIAAPPSQPAQDQAAAAAAPATQAPSAWPAAQPNAATAPWPAPQGQAAVAPWPGTPPAQRTQ